MISLVYPKEKENRYLIWMGLCLGPFDASGIYSGDWINFDSSLESMTEKKGIYHENDVTHDKFEGILEYHPILGGAIPTPTAQFPRKMDFPVKDYLGRSKWVSADYGLCVPGGSTFGRITPTANSPLHYAYDRDPNSLNWSIWKVQMASGSPYKINAAQRYDLVSIQPYSGDTWKFVYTVATYNLGGSAGFPTDVDWTMVQTFATIRKYCTGINPLVTSHTGYGSVYTANPGLVMPPKTVKQRIDSLLATLFPEGFPLREEHYGELAHVASQKVNANKVNMIAFLKDLRHPTAMIPKLRNLRNIKGMADNYLSVKYGVLPTVSDLENIVEAFRKIGPYVDRNGFEILTARHQDQLEKDGFSFTLDQRIKLAIGEEDNDFEALISRLESFGVLPTFENLWDLTKYSFVVDWFVDVGGFLERVDSGLRLARLNIAYVTMSRKKTISGSYPGGSQFPFGGTVNSVHYHRWVSDQCPVPPLSLQFKSEGFNHWLEAGALIVQRSK